MSTTSKLSPTDIKVIKSEMSAGYIFAGFVLFFGICLDIYRHSTVDTPDQLQITRMIASIETGYLVTPRIIESMPITHFT